MGLFEETPIEFGVMLHRMSEKRVFDVQLSEDGKEIEFIDGCDSCFGVKLNKTELLLMCEELESLSNKLTVK